jgi:hypothetical protein
MGAPYDEAALDYLMAGMSPIPVRGKTMPVKHATGYDGVVTGEHVLAWLDTNPTARARAGRGVGVDNIAIRHQRTVAIDVDEGYGDKNGVAKLAEWATSKGLPPLPATWSSTARGDDSGSRQYLYAIDEDVTFKTKPCEAVELCCWHHRFTVCWPTVHPGTGTLYCWYEPGEPGTPPTWGSRVTDGRIPTRGDLAPLPDEWRVALRGGTANADRDAAVVDLGDLVDGFTPGEPDGLVRHHLTKWSNPEQHVGHDEAKNALITAFMLGREGRPGAAQLVDLIVQRFRAYLGEARPQMADGELASLLTATSTIAQQKPITPPAPIVAEPIPAGGLPRDRVINVELDRITPATDDELTTWLDSYTAYSRPTRLGRRTEWMRQSPPEHLYRHAVALVSDSLAGYVPAAKVVATLRGAYEAAGGTDTAVVHDLLAHALGSILNRVGAE